jgi:hypothetical protein
LLSISPKLPAHLPCVLVAWQTGKSQAQDVNAWFSAHDGFSYNMDLIIEDSSLIFLLSWFLYEASYETINCFVLNTLRFQTKYLRSLVRSFV